MLEARNITFSYQGARRALYDNFSLQVEPGERVALCAPSGFGKTTLCRMLAGYEQPQKGEVLIDGAPFPKRGVFPVQMIWQHPELALDARMRLADSLAEGCARFEMTGLSSSLRLALRPSHASHVVLQNEDAQDLMRALGIKQHWLTRFPHELSGGELQRFCIARALAANPRYVIADEMSTMLDALTQAELWHFILEEAARRNLGLVFVSHSPALTERIATRVVKLG